MLGSTMRTLARPSARVCKQQTRTWTRLSQEAQRFSFPAMIEDLAASGSLKEFTAKGGNYAEEIGMRVKHGWFRDGVTHPNGDLPPDGLQRMNWQDQHVAFVLGDPVGTYTPTQMVVFVAGCWGAFIGMCTVAIKTSSASNAKKAEAELNAEKEKAESLLA